MRKTLLLIVFLFCILAACSTAPPLIITATPDSPTALPITVTVEIAPSWTPPPFVASATPPPDAPTPTQEVFCNEVSIDHRCYLNKPVNPNAYFDPPPLTVSPNLTTYTFIRAGAPETVTKNVQIPGPPDYYKWSWDMIGNFEGLQILGWIPSIQYRYATNEYAANITSASGLLMLHVENFAAQANVKYLVKLSYRLDLFSRSGKPYADAKADWIGLCSVTPDGNSPAFTSPPQGLSNERTAWDDKETMEAVLLSLAVERDANLRFACGIRLNWPAWEGEVLFNALEILPVDWTEVMVTIR